MDWLYYLLEANLYLAIFYCFYCLFLQNETFYNSNRYFLLIATLASFVLPVLQIGFLKLPIQQDLIPTSEVRLREANVAVNWLYISYLIIACCFAFKLCLNIYSILKIWFTAKRYTTGDITLVEINGETTAFSFFNLLFIHPEFVHQPSVLKHEMVHIKQRHSFDVLFFELIQVICWFNPTLYFLKKEIKLLHEYIADDITTSNDVQKHEYALFLIQNSFGIKVQPITNQIFNQSILKRRINMLNKKRTAGWARLRLLLAVPLAGAMLCTSTMAFTKDYGYVDLLPEKSNIAITKEQPKIKSVQQTDTLKLKKVKKQDQIKFPPPIVRPNKARKSLDVPPPPVEPAPTTKKIVKFPPPSVKADKPKISLKVPPPPVEAPPAKQDQVKFPPPIVKPDKKKTSNKAAQVGEDVKVTGDPIKN
jgi:hypothetical protein